MGTAHLVLISALLLAGCSDHGATTSSPTGFPSGGGELRPVVAVASGPAELLAAAAVGPERVERVAPEGAPLDRWRPDDDALDAMVSARRVLVLGDEAEPWLQRAGLPPSRTVRLDAAIPEASWIEVGSFAHTHGGGESHTHGGVVAEAWTDPALLRAMAQRTRGQLGAVLGEGEASAPAWTLGARIDAYADELDALAEALDGRALIATHHGLEYLCRAAGIRLEVTELELDGGGSHPNDDAVRRLAELAGQEGAHAGVLVWPGPLDSAFAEKARQELGLRSVDFDLGASLAGSDTLTRLTQSTARLRAAIAPE
ncbi:zinc ABC transporter substrate-binding protein [Planctomycetota bacterium]|nr:zinc ABC transporter substrate-binding protein [Planctomycetota bacterium]